jgi:short-chain fatty acids transporter
MLAQVGQYFADRTRRLLPDPFVFAILLTLLVGILCIACAGATPLGVLKSWYQGFWMLLGFGMQIVLILATGYALAISPPLARVIDWLASRIRTPAAVYVVVTFVGALFSLVNWGWLVLTAILARELALRIRGVHLPYLAACVFLSAGPWVCGLSSTIPLLLNTEKNFLISAGVLADTIPVGVTLGTTLNALILLTYLIGAPLLMLLMRPPADRTVELRDLTEQPQLEKPPTVAQEAVQDLLPGRALSDRLNSSILLQVAIVCMGLGYIAWHFGTRGFDLDLNIMIFIFFTLGMLCHQTPLRYAIAMKRACSSIYGIIFQYPFYAGIMGMMVHTGLGAAAAGWMAATASATAFPAVAYVTGAIVNFAIPSAGGEWAVLGQPTMEIAKTLSAGWAPEAVTTYLARSAMAVAYGESQTNALSPFFILIILPVLGAGLRLQARDILGYMLVPFALFFVINGLLVTFMPI